MTQSSLQTPFGSFILKRFPQNHDKSLRAWDAADEYLLSQVSQLELKKDPQVVIFNDSFGALATALHQYHPMVSSDSYLAHQAIKKNLELNGINADTCNLLTSLQTPGAAIDLLLIKVPKVLDHLQDYLYRISSSLSANTIILIAGMQKNLPKTLWTYLENQIGNTNTHLAVKKAKLIEVTFENRNIDSKYPSVFELPESGYKICNHANVFSKQSLDIGARFLLNHSPEFDDANDIVDLGCGNGVLGLHFAKTHPDARVHFVDESFMAIESAKLTLNANFEDTQRFQFHTNHGLSGWDPSCVDLVLCNPPFHQNQAVGTHIAKDMFRQAYHALRPGGQLLVIANRHLPYFGILKRKYSRVKTIASDRKFNLYLATK